MINSSQILSNHARVTYHFGPFALHAGSRLLMRDGVVVPLTSKAFETLLVLVRRAGSVVGKDELLRQVWPNTVVEESNLTQTIFMLRKALGDAVREHRFIVTVPKQGYCFVAEVRERPDAGDAAAGPLPLARTLLGKRHTENTEAYQLCLKGRHFWEKRTAGAVEKAIRCFHQALEKDSRYARAYAGLADCYAILSQCSRLPPAETMPKARAAAMEALRLDDSLVEAHASLALVKMLYDWDWPGAEAEFRVAMTLDPGYATAHHWHGMWLVARGRFDEAIAELERAQRLEPLSVAINTDLGLVLYLARRYEDAVTQYRAAIDLDAGFTDAQMGILMAYGEMGMSCQPISEFLRAPETFTREVAATLEVAYAQSGVRGYWRAFLELAESPSSEVYSSPYVRARLYAALGDVAHALQWIEIARDVRDAGLSLLRVDPGLDTLRAEPRVRVVLEQVGLAE
jgi:DNA-binding winged helix-turn-helix (wHTH) protein/tetratricopeptide (TPR) repeat protein